MNKVLKRLGIVLPIILLATVACIMIMHNTDHVTVARAEDVSRKTVQARYDGGDNYEDILTFVLTNDGTAYKVRAKDKLLTEISIPETYGGLPVTEISDNAFLSCKNLKTVFIPSSVTKISGNAFYKYDLDSFNRS